VRPRSPQERGTRRRGSAQLWPRRRRPQCAPSSFPAFLSPRSRRPPAGRESLSRPDWLSRRKAFFRPPSASHFSLAAPGEHAFTRRRSLSLQFSRSRARRTTGRRREEEKRGYFISLEKSFCGSRLARAGPLDVAVTPVSGLPDVDRGQWGEGRKWQRFDPRLWCAGESGLYHGALHLASNMVLCELGGAGGLRTRLLLRGAQRGRRRQRRPWGNQPGTLR